MGQQPAGHSVDLELLSAALRHLRDAEHLADAMSPHVSLDQAHHLAGFAPECARKAAIAAEWVNKPLGHILGNKADAVLELASILAPAATDSALQGWGKTYKTLGRWDPAHRYDESGTHKRPQVEALLRESRQVVIEIMAALWADGRLPLESIQ